MAGGEPGAPISRRAPEVLVPFIGGILIGALFLGLIVSFGPGAAASIFGLVFIAISVAFLAAAALIWRRNRIGYVLAIIMSLLFIAAFGFQASAALTAFADLPSFLEVIVILPVLLLVFVYSILGLRLVWRKGSAHKTVRMIPTSSVLALVTLGFVIGGALIGAFANGAVLAIGRNANTQADITIVVGASNTGTAQPFTPANFTMKAGGTVTWVNKDTVTHTVTSTSVPSGASSFDSGNLLFGHTFNATLTVPGTYQYYCTIHPLMKGTIVVTSG